MTNQQLDPTARKKQKTIYAYVCERDGQRIYTSFDVDLDAMIDAAETWKLGVVAIEEAHAGKPPVWTRPVKGQKP